VRGLWGDSLVWRVLVVAGSRTKCIENGSGQHQCSSVNVLSLAVAISKAAGAGGRMSCREGKGLKARRLEQFFQCQAG